MVNDAAALALDAGAAWLAQQRTSSRHSYGLGINLLVMWVLSHGKKTLTPTPRDCTYWAICSTPSPPFHQVL